MDIVMAFLLALCAGVVVGVLSGLLGIGGGVIMVPLFRLAFALEPIMATATSLFCILPTALSGVVTHARNRTCVPWLGVAMGVGGAVLSPVGVWLATMSPDVAIMGVTAAIMVYSSVTMVRKALRAPKGGAGFAAASKRERAGAAEGAKGADGADGAKGGQCAAVAAASESGNAYPAGVGVAIVGRAESAGVGVAIAGRAENAGAGLAIASSEKSAGATESVGDAPVPTMRRVLVGAAVGAFAGLCSGYVGVGGGFIMIPLMVSLLDMPMRKASGTSLIGVAIIAVPSIITQAALGNIALLAGLGVICGSVPGAVLGARLVSRVPERALRLMFAGLLVVAAVALVVKELA